MLGHIIENFRWEYRARENDYVERCEKEPWNYIKLAQLNAQMEVIGCALQALETRFYEWCDKHGVHSWEKCPKCEDGEEVSGHAI